MTLAVLIILLIVFTIFLVFGIQQPKSKLAEVYTPEHIDDFVDFAKTQLHLPKVEAIKAIRMAFSHLSLMQAVEVYELAGQANDHS